MSFTKRFKETMRNVFKKKQDKNYDYKDSHKQRLIDLRKFKTTVTRLEKPTNLVRARTLGYKAKTGVFTVIVKTARGGGLFRQPNRGRRPKRMGFKKLTRNISTQTIAEMKASKKYVSCEVINSYFVGQDGNHLYYEVILADKNQPEILADKNLNKIVKANGRAERGLTSSAKKTRGLRKVKDAHRK